MISTVTKIAYCSDKQCKYRKDIDVRRLLIDALDSIGLREKITLVETECLISCLDGPSIMFLPDGKVYQVSTTEGFADLLVTRLPGRILLVRKPPMGEGILVVVDSEPTGLTPVDKLMEALPILDIPAVARKHNKTLCGMIAMHLGRIPKPGEGFDYAALCFEIIRWIGFV